MESRRRVPVSVRLMLLVSVAFTAGAAVNSSEFRRALRAASHNAPTVARIDTVVLTTQMSDDSLGQWKTEVSRRFNDAVLVFVHGGDLNGKWQAHVNDFDPKPMDEVIADVRVKFGDRKIILVSCNPGHYRLPDSVGDVVYATDNVWMAPDYSISERQAENPTAVGNIYEFLTTLP